MRRFLLSAAALMAAVGCTDVAVDDTLVMEPAPSAEAKTIYANVAAPAATRMTVSPEIGESINNVDWRFRWVDTDKMSTWSNGTAVTKLIAAPLDAANFTDETGSTAPFTSTLHAGATQFRFVYPANTYNNKVTGNTIYTGFNIAGQNTNQGKGIGLAALGARALMVSDLITYEDGKTTYEPTMRQIGAFVQFRADIVNGDPTKEYLLTNVKIGTNIEMMQLPMIAEVDMTKNFGDDGFMTLKNAVLSLTVLNGNKLASDGSEYLRAVVLPFSVAEGDQIAIEYTYYEIGGGETKLKTTNTTTTFDYAADYIAGTHNGIVINCDVSTGEDVIVYPWEGIGTAADPFLISDEDDLFAIEAGTVNVGSNNFNSKYFLMTNDITLTKPWEPIGYKDSEDYKKDISFGGTFNGGDHTIYGLNVDKSEPIGFKADGTSPLYESAGLFALVHATGTVQNLTVEGEVKGSIRAGGIAGHSNGKILNCTNRATVSGKQFVAGVVGNTALTVNGCTNYGDITGTEQLTGGIVGQAFSNSKAIVNVNSSVNYGDVTGVKYVGGICGYINTRLYNPSSPNANLNRAINYGDITATGQFCGGIAGQNIAYVLNAINHGTIKGVNNVGGISGYHYKNSNAGGLMYNIINTGDVTGNTQVGGIAGECRQVITSAITTGHVTVEAANGTGGEIGGMLAAPKGNPIYTKVFYIIDNMTLADGSIHSNQMHKSESVITGYATLDEMKADADNIFATMMSAPYDTDVRWTMDPESGLPTFDTKDVLANDHTNSGAVKGEKRISGAENQWIDFGYKTWNGGNGTKDYPYQIANPYQFARFIELVNVRGMDFDGEYFMITAAIGLGGNLWQTVGSAEHPFKGKIDFKGNYVKNVAFANGQQFTTDMQDVIYCENPETQIYGNTEDRPYITCDMW